jgi:hypothetical protein
MIFAPVSFISLSSVFYSLLVTRQGVMSNES